MEFDRTKLTEGLAAGALAAGGLSLYALTRGRVGAGVAEDAVSMAESMQARVADYTAWKTDSRYLSLFRSELVRERSPYGTWLPDGSFNQATLNSYFDLLPPISSKQTDLVNFVRDNGQLERVDDTTQIGAWNGRQFVFHEGNNISAVRRYPYAFSVIDHSLGSAQHFRSSGTHAGLGIFKDGEMQLGATSSRKMRRASTDYFYSGKNVPLGKQLMDLREANPEKLPPWPQPQIYDPAQQYHDMALDAVRQGKYKLDEQRRPFMTVLTAGGLRKYPITGEQMREAAEHA